MILADATSPLGLSVDGRTVILTLAGAFGLTLLMAALARRLRMPPILLFILGGLCVGQAGLHVLRPESLGHTWEFLLLIGAEVILFAAGLCLPPKGYRETTWETRGILTSGVIITWGLTAGAIHVLNPAFSWPVCLLCGSLVIATGPAVVAPVLQRLHLRQRLHHILYWESALCDPIGAFAALACFTVATVAPGMRPSHYGLLAFQNLAGLLMGVAGGLTLAALLRVSWLSKGGAPVALLAGAAVIPAASDLVIPGSGLLSALVAGLTLGRHDLPTVRTLRRNRPLLMDTLAAPLLVLVAAHLTPDHARALGWRGLVAVLIVVFAVRPLTVFLSTTGGALQANDKLFLSWIAPRGIVPAVLAAAFALRYPAQLAENGAAQFMEAFVFVLIVATVSQALAAGAVGRRLDVLDPGPTAWLIAGGHALGRRVAAFIRDAGLHVAIADDNAKAAAAARRDRLPTIASPALTIDLEEHPNLYGVGHVLAITESPDMNLRICRRFAEERPELKLYRWAESTASAPPAGQPSAAAGQPIWPILRAQDMRTVGEEADEPGLDIRESRVADIHHPERVLLCAHDGQISPTLPTAPDARVTVLSYRPLTVGLHLNLRPEWIIYSRAGSMAQLFIELLDCLRGAHPGLDMEAVRANLVRQEHEYSSYVGYETALPHFHVDQLSASVVLVAKLDQPLTDSHGGSQMRYVFLVLSPSSEPRTHLQALAEISRFVMDDNNRERLAAAHDTASLRHAFFPRGTSAGS